MDIRIFPGAWQKMESFALFSFSAQDEGGAVAKRIPVAGMKHCVFTARATTDAGGSAGPISMMRGQKRRFFGLFFPQDRHV